MAEPVTIYEMGPRDGLQNQARLIPTADKIALVDMLSETGLRKIEVTSFVSPKWVPQMADAAEVMAGITRAPGLTCGVLTPNLRGLERALEAGAREVALFASASAGFSKANINATIAESMERLRPVAKAALAAGATVRGYVSCITDCPFDGSTPPAKIATVTQALLEMGCYEVSLSDTIGQATHETLVPALEAALTVAHPAQLAGHYHDTGSRALDNIRLSLEYGLRTFDAAAGGLGGCPYAPGAAGNVATEAVVEMLEASGFETGIDLPKLRAAATFARSL